MTKLPQISVSDKVLLHLSRIRVDRDSELAPSGSCQEGIADAVGISRSHVPRAVKELLSHGLVEEAKKRVKDGEKRVKAYLITTRGLSKAQQIEDHILSQVVPAKVQNTIVNGMTIQQIENAFHKRIDILKITGEEEYLDLDSVSVTGVTDFTDSPKTSMFLDREESLDSMKHFLKSHAKILALYGARGIGTSALTKHFIELLDEWNVLWISLLKNETVEKIQDRIDLFTKMLGSTPDKVLFSSAGNNTLIAFDGYFDVDEHVVELFSGYSDRREGAKIIVACRDSTPSYNRFYRKEHVDSGIIQEMTLKGLPHKEAKVLLGNEEISEEAFSRIFAMSRGSPMILSLLRDRDETGLRRNTTFTNEEIRFLLVEAAVKKN